MSTDTQCEREKIDVNSNLWNLEIVGNLSLCVCGFCEVGNNSTQKKFKLAKYLYDCMMDGKRV